MTKQEDNWVTTPEKQRRKALHKAADLAADFQSAVAGFHSNGTKELTKHQCAERMIETGEALLKAQVATGSSLGIQSSGIRHRVLLAETYLADNPAIEKSTTGGNGAWEYYVDNLGRRIQKFR